MCNFPGFPGFPGTPSKFQAIPVINKNTIKKARCGAPRSCQNRSKLDIEFK